MKKMVNSGVRRTECHLRFLHYEGFTLINGAYRGTIVIRPWKATSLRNVVFSSVKKMIDLSQKHASRVTLNWKEPFRTTDAK